ncbi:hypothetical protein CEXT_12431 [Caerostris extrusa]|uniref:Uncharacterized protein n=1 Tax=Caerostris extrusa TaxID=172846 RepID=A0AAV4UX31_CAEEX|nr:hypothetical protein CEXT_12431 [Caerostris extrusa]
MSQSSPQQKKTDCRRFCDSKGIFYTLNPIIITAKGFPPLNAKDLTFFSMRVRKMANWNFYFGHERPPIKRLLPAVRRKMRKDRTEFLLPVAGVNGAAFTNMQQRSFRRNEIRAVFSRQLLLELIL